MGIKRFVKRIKHVIKWLPVIWDDHDYDYSYIYKILHFKLQNVEDFERSTAVWNADAKELADEIKVAKDILKRLIDDNYFNNALTEFEAKYGDNYNLYTMEPIEASDGYRMVEAGTEQQHKEFSNAGKHADYMEKQDREYLFNYIAKHIKNWWD